MTRKGSVRAWGRSVALAGIPFAIIGALTATDHGVQAAATPAAPRLSLSELAPVGVLAGNHATISLTASNPGGVPLYGLAVREVLPAGVAYRPGSVSPAAAGEPAILADTPAAGGTTLVWRDLADLSPGSTAPLSFQVDPAVAPAPGAIAPGSSFTTDSAAYATTDRSAPVAVDTLTGKASGTALQSATAGGTTQIDTLLVTVTGPTADGKLLRGVHDHQGVVGVTVANNGAAATQNVVVDGYLSSALEFLGCGTADNGRIEYPYASHLSGHSAAPAGCAPDSGETLALTKDALGAALPASPAWTHVHWTLGTLAPGDSRTLSFLTAVPLRANAPFGAGAPSAASLKQLANLDDNTGAATDQAGAQTVLVDAAGLAANGSATSSSASTSITPVDMTVSKAVDQPVFTAGGTAVETITLTTSEYVHARGVQVAQALPSGLAPGLAATTPAAAVPATELASGVSNQGWTIDSIAPDGTATISVPLRDLAHYRATNADAGPTAAGDSFADVVTATASAATLRCASPDGLCAKGAVQGIDGSIPAQSLSPGATDGAVLQTAAQPTVIASIAQRPAAGTAMSCATATYAPVAASPFVKGDLTCARIHVLMPATPGRNQVLRLALPDSVTPDAAVIDAAAPTALAAAQRTGDPAGVVSWALGTADPADASGTLWSAAGGTLDLTLPLHVIKDPASTLRDDASRIDVRVLGASASGVLSAVRAALTLPVTQPRLDLHAGVVSVLHGATTEVVPGAGTTQWAGARAGELVTLRATVTNGGAVDARATEVWLQLPDGTTCANVKQATAGGVCDAGVVRWDIAHGASMTVPAGTSRSLDVALTAPSNLHALDVVSATAAVRSFTTATDVGTTNRYAPTDNIDGSARAGAAPAEAPASSAILVSADPPLHLVRTAPATASATTPTDGTSTVTYRIHNGAINPGDDPSGGATGNDDIVTVTFTPAAGLQLTGLSGTNWNCTVATGVCTNDTTGVPAHPSQSIPQNGNSDSITATYKVTAQGTGQSLSLVTGMSSQKNGTADQNLDTPQTFTVTVPAPNLSVSTSTSPANPPVGGTVTIHNTVANAANASHTDTSIPITVTNALTTGWTVHTPPAAGWTCSFVAANLDCLQSGVITAIPAGGSTSFDVVVDIIQPDFSTSPNTPSATGGGNSGTATGTASPIVPGHAILAITQTSATVFHKGGTGSFTVSVVNTGNRPSHTLGFTDSLNPAHTSDLVQLSPSAVSGPTITCSAPGGANQVSCSTSGIPADSASYSFTVNFNVSAASLSHPSTAAPAIDSQLLVTETVPAGGLDDPKTYTPAATTPPPPPAHQSQNDLSVPIAQVDLAPGLTVTPTTLGFGGAADYVVSVTGTGAVPASFSAGVVTVDVDLDKGAGHDKVTVDNGLVVNGWSCTGAGGATTVHCTLTAHNVSDPWPSFTIHALVDDNANPTVTPEVRLDNPEIDPNTVNNTLDPAAIPVTGSDFSGTVYRDVNGNGHFNAGTDAPLKNVTVTLVGTGFTATSDAAGAYTIGNHSLRPGTYHLSYDFSTVDASTPCTGCKAGLDDVGAPGGTPDAIGLTPVNSRDITGITFDKQLAGTVIPGYNAGAIQSRTVQGHVFLDNANDNGIFDGTDSNLSGYTVAINLVSSIFTTTTGVVSSGATSASGLITTVPFAFPGTYSVQVTPPASSRLLGISTVILQGSSTNTSPQIPKRTDTSQLRSGVDMALEGTQSVEFGELDPAHIAGVAFHDYNDNGTFNNLVTDNPVERPVATLPPLHIPPFAPDAAVASITITGTDDIAAASASPNSTAFSSVLQANADGTFDFTTLRPGTYTITSTLPTGLAIGVKNQVGGAGGTDHLISTTNDDINTITLQGGTNGAGYGFAFVDPSSISGNVFVDLNDNGRKDLSDLLLAGLTSPPTLANYPTITLSGTDDRGNDVTTTVPAVQPNLLGVYTFSNVRPPKTGTKYQLKLTTSLTLLDGTDRPGTSTFLQGTFQAASLTATGTWDPAVAASELDAIAMPLTGETLSGFDFPLVAPSQLSGYVYDDPDNNGCFHSTTAAPGSFTSCAHELVSPNEAGLPAQLVTLTGTDDRGQAVRVSAGHPWTATTDSHGAYAFGTECGTAAKLCLRPGVYTLTLTPTAPNFAGIAASGTVKRLTDGSLITAVAVGTGSSDASGAVTRIALCDVDTTGALCAHPPVAVHAWSDAFPLVCSAVTQCSGVAGSDYDLAEVKPAKIQAIVWLDTDEQDTVGTFPGTQAGLGGVPVSLEGVTNRGPVGPIAGVTGPDGIVTFPDPTGTDPGLYPGVYSITVLSNQGFRTGPITIKPGASLLRGSAGLPDIVPQQSVTPLGVTNIPVVSGALASPNILFAFRPPAADLAVTVAHTGNFTAGLNGDYTITVTNTGPSPAIGPITVIDTLPDGMAFVSGGDKANLRTRTTTPWQCVGVGQTVLCAIPDTLAVGETATPLDVQVSVSPDLPPSSVTNLVTANSPTTDLIPDNNTDRQDVTGITTVSDLGMTVDISGLFGDKGQGVYIITVHNFGPSASPAGFTISDTFPHGLRPILFAGDWGCGGSGQTVTCGANAPLEPNDDRAVALFTLVGLPNGNSVDNFATVTSANTDPNSGNNTTGVRGTLGQTVGTATLNGPLPNLPTSGAGGISGPDTGAGRQRWTEALLLVTLGTILVGAAVLLPGRRRKGRSAS